MFPKLCHGLFKIIEERIHIFNAFKEKMQPMLAHGLVFFSWVRDGDRINDSKAIYEFGKCYAKMHFCWRDKIIFQWQFLLRRANLFCVVTRETGTVFFTIIGQFFIFIHVSLKSGFLKIHCQGNSSNTPFFVYHFQCSPFYIVEVRAWSFFSVWF